MSKRNRGLDRRSFISVSAAGTAAAWGGYFSALPARAARSPNEKLNIAAVGTGGMAAADISSLAHENIYALCDVDENTLGTAGGKFPKAQRYFDYRVMFELERSNIDAVLVATPDHIHAPASVMAMRLGKHVYCQKPLAWSVDEARVMSKLAAESKVATQMGNQIHSSDNFRRVIEIVRSGAIGPVREVAVWCGKGWGGGKRPTETFEVPANLKWDLWLGPAPVRPYAPNIYHPANWRRWWDFGGGTLGDMACHLVDLPFWALELPQPSTIEAAGPPVDPETTPLGMSVVYEFASSNGGSPVKMTWHDGDRTPQEIAGHKVPGMGVMFIGDNGQMFADYGGYKLYPEDKFKDFAPPEKTIPSSVGHWQEWIDACKTGSPTGSNFDYAARLSEVVLLGNVAYRAGQKITWDGAAGQLVDCPAAKQYLGREYRKGWTL
jgi:predicted dehydrogenase